MRPAHVAVVGAGLAGAATAWQLARAGCAVTLLERRVPASPDGSSHGSARIFRYAYPDPFYARLVVEARADWDELERLSGSPLITPAGAVDFGTDRDPAALAAVFEQVGVAHELLGPAAARERWPGIAFDTDVLWHPDAGVIDAEASVEAMVRLAEADGAVVETGWALSRVERAASGLRLHAVDGRVVAADHVVVAAGGWLPALLDDLALPAGFRARLPRFTVSQEYAYHFPYRPADAPWPTVIHKVPGMHVYALPGGRDAGYRGQKVAEFLGGTPLASAEEQDGRVSAANRERVTDYVARSLPGLEPEPYAETTCLFTMTPSEDFVLDGADGVTVVSPCSGHGAKFAPLIGRIAAESVLGTARAPSRFLVAA